MSDLLRSAADSWGEINTQKYVIDQHRAVMREAGISPERWGGKAQSMG
ncbi:hypothetical protein PSPTO_3931 [Pseudomonas syringae pv. tomato str. DC3000]|uniref:Uncharacterized protein n=1 Tax=Pseudomonas syringae pv. tomato (strain ATCC BAA-871 / DC3000) TaxID=223283 RepID=Q87Y74_PSESM|nr:hypothetical protein PSPTO_3931 [Pseudomonas syringae pv. tomato str. DC3000]TES79931.1 hypothetical protein E2N89_05700 [Pseudomonas syringae pv. tomato]